MRPRRGSARAPPDLREHLVHGPSDGCRRGCPALGSGHHGSVRGDTARAAARSPRACRPCVLDLGPRSMRSIPNAVVELEAKTIESSRPMSASIPSSASACEGCAGSRRGEPVLRVVLAEPLPVSSIIRSSGTSCRSPRSASPVGRARTPSRSRRGGSPPSRCVGSRTRPGSARLRAFARPLGPRSKTSRYLRKPS